MVDPGELEQAYEEIVSRIGGQIYTCRAAVGMSQEEVAEALGVTAEYVRQLEAGHRTPSLKIIVGLSLLLETDIETFFVESESPTPAEEGTGRGRRSGRPRGR